ncbi:lasso peptide biosynthesis B2 protein [Gloeocapsopsis crepidinum LEGE 06123]|uniref:Lasso peptide biosynthesis B2 protein n=1 Tax=Gloeocapsopsis crepidinum LEGE 06123 TaxID=588587 RepID=A0ABR9ULE9_9CHRO|nr:lasso peptide biosynthesis B2 protein [Gloeocapsopsis crepidinum]MBE9189111.1 lasso peptide biosynthesis B2 protein [Gloeocapsopsis crepidinum LEGE 06123]
MSYSVQQKFNPTVIVEGSGAYRLKQDVIVVLQDGVARLLGLNRGKFYGLDTVGTKMLMLLLDRNPEETAQAIANEYGVTKEQVQADANKLLHDLQRKQLIDQLPQLQHPKLPSYLTISVLLTLAWISIRTLGWTRTIRLWRRWQRSTTYKVPDKEAVQAVDALVREGAAKYPLLPMACKERALVGWQILKTTFHFPAELVVGINLYPFQAHAWVECGSWTVTDNQSNCENFIAAARYS